MYLCHRCFSNIAKMPMQYVYMTIAKMAIQYVYMTIEKMIIYMYTYCIDTFAI